MKKSELNYFALMPTGIIFIFLGLILDGNTKLVFIFLGIIFLIASFANKDKWQKSKKHKK